MHEFWPIRTFSPVDGGNRQPVVGAASRESQFGVGSIVRVRGRVGRVASLRRHDACTAVGVRFASGDPADLVVMAPFDRLQWLPEGIRWARCGWRTLLGAVVRATADATGLPDAGRAAPASALRLLDWQLEPALTLLEGRASRVLVADAVGLGKTVQAAWALLATCDPSRDRALVLTPAGLRDQWQGELCRLFGLDATVVDAGHLRRLRQGLPQSVSPWSLPGVFIAAIDFVKQPEVLAGLLDTRWSLVVLDEAHGLTAHTDRRRAADLLARHADHVLLLTATPHSGDAAAFAELCRIGTVGGDELVTIRRSRADVQLPERRTVGTVAIRPVPAERRLHEALRLYLRHVRSGALLDADASALLRWVLLKRAASSSQALLRSLIRRRDAVAGVPAAPEQEDLPFGESGEHDTADDWMPDVIDIPALPDRQSETALLDHLIACAREAARVDSKVSALQRLLRRVREPALVFTEYRDTLDHVASGLADGITAARLHGGMSRVERREAERAFRTGAARILLATDAAGEGLNLHHTCRLVISVDVPWNPTRLEQRIGRVDRIGQRQRVHALILTGMSAADRILAGRFTQRQRRIAEDLDRVHAGSGASERAAASGERLRILRSATALVRSAAARPAPHGRATGSVPRAIPWRDVRPSLRRRLQLPRGVLLLYAVSAMTECGAIAASTAVPVAVQCGSSVPRGGIRQVLRACDRAARPVAARHAAAALQEARRVHRQRLVRLRRRLTASLAQVPESPPHPYQAGLFDRRTMTAALRRRAADRDRRRELRDALDRLAALDRIGAEPRVRPVAALVLR